MPFKGERYMRDYLRRGDNILYIIKLALDYAADEKLFWVTRQPLVCSTPLIVIIIIWTRKVECNKEQKE